jgi:response regulator of citrate/malate metabolism
MRAALDYLMKPFDDTRFSRALDRAKDTLAHYTPPQQRNNSPRFGLSSKAGAKCCL